MSVSGEDKEKLFNAMLQAYRKKTHLEQMVEFKLNKNLNEIAGGDTTRDIIFNLINWYESTGKLQKLLIAISKDEDRQDNRQLQKTVRKLLKKLTNSYKKFVLVILILVILSISISILRPFLINKKLEFPKAAQNEIFNDSFST